MEDKASSTDTHNDLLEAFKGIHNAFSPKGNGYMGDLSLYQIEDHVHAEMFTLFNNCQSMARDIITGKIFGSFACYSYCGDPDVDAAASETIWKLFGHRKCLEKNHKSQTGILEIVGVVQSLYDKNPEPTGLDAYKWLRKTVFNHVSHYNYEQLAEKNPEYAKTGKKISRFLKNSERYACDGSLVKDISVKLDSPDSRRPSVEEIVTLCGCIEPQPTNIPTAVDLIFDILANNTEFRSKVSINVLRSAVFRLLEPRLPSWTPGVTQKTPWDDFLLGMTERAAMETIDYAKRNYSWRKQFAEAEKAAFLEAGADYLFDVVYRDKPSASLRKYLTAYLEECSSEIYESKYKGSAQYFFDFLLDNYRMRVQDDNPRNIARNSKKSDANREVGDI